MTHIGPEWEALLARVRLEAAGAEGHDGTAVAEWLGAPDGFELPAPRSEAAAAFEPYMSLLHAYQRLNRSLSEALYRRSYDEGAPLLSSDFGDWAVGSLVREAYLDLHLASAAFWAGLDIQVMCLLRQMAELTWRALIVAAEPRVADEWWQTSVAGAGAGKRADLDKHLWARHFRPARQIKLVGDIEARLDGLCANRADEHARETIGTLSRIYKLLSGPAHGGSELVYTSVMRGAGGWMVEDPFSRLGEPTDLGLTLLAAALNLQARFWRYFPRAAFRPAPSLSSEEATLVRAAEAVNAVVERDYRESLRKGIAED